MPHPLHDVLVVFMTEVTEQLREVAELLLKADADGANETRRALYQRIARIAHSTKGNAGAFGLDELEALMHAVESSLAPALASGAKVAPALAQHLLTAFDRVPPYLKAMLDERPMDSLAPSIEALLEPPTPPSAAPASEPVVAPRPSAPPPLPPKPMPSAPPPVASAPRPSLEDAPDERLRVSQERVAALDQRLDELRELKAILDHRSEELRQLRLRLERPDDPAEAARMAREVVRGLHRSLSADAAELAARLGDAADEVRAMRMVSLSSAVAGLRRAIWEHARSVGKSVELEVAGLDVALDRRVVEEIKDALLHLARNGVDHGLEAPAQRAAVGKPAAGQLSLTAELRRGRALITFRDDGRGVDFAAVRARAVERGLLSTDASQADLAEVLFAPGFSTAEVVTRTSGRGVGLNVVRDNLARVGGSVRLETVEGRGTSFLLEVPVSVSAAQALVVEAGSYRFALALSEVVTASLAGRQASQRTVEVSGAVVPLRVLSELLRLPTPGARRASVPIVVVASRDRLLGLEVDAVLGERDVVVRPIPPELARLPGLAAATQLGDGQLAFVLSAARLLELSSDAVARLPTPVPSAVRVVVCDDSLTTRTLHRQVLEAAGFQVRTSHDGEDGWRLLKEEGADVLVSDVRMPRLDGLALCRRVRADPRFRHLPVVLVSSLDSDADRERAEAAGASAYVTKQAYQRGGLVHILTSLVQRR